MKKIFAVATFVVAGAGSLVAGATATLPSFNGSDTIGRVTLEEVGPKDTSVAAVAPYTAQTFAQAPVGFPNFSLTAAVPGASPNEGVGLCSGASVLEYLGGGSGSGEGDMDTTTPTQDIAPMSRFMQASSGTTGGVCNKSNGSLADGIVFALDGLSILASSANGTNNTCNATNNTACSAATGQVAAAGLAYDQTASAQITSAQRATAPYLTAPSGGWPNFAFTSWHDVLDILYAGFVDPTIHQGTDPDAADPEIGKNCASSLRFALANNYGDLFENPSCSSSQGCTQIQHIFRRDDASGTSDIFGALLGLSPSAAYNKNQVASTVGTYFLGADPFCNDIPNNTLSGGKINGVKAASDAVATWATVWPGNNTPANGTANVGNVPDDDQDFDPIRRACQGSSSTFVHSGEQVCERATFDVNNPTCTGTGAGTCPVNPQTGRQESCYNGQCWDKGTLGFLLPVITTNTVGTDSQNTALNDQYNLIQASGTPVTNNCCNNLQTINKCVSVGQALVPLVPNPAGGKPFDGLCPNGDESQTAGGECYVPVDANGNPNCWSTSVPQLCNGDCTQGVLGQQASSGAGPNVLNQIDSRVYNLYAYTFGSKGWVVNVDDSQRPLTGAYYRIHTSESLLSSATGSCGQNTAVCAQPDATQQIGCLVQASPCSVGYAGRAASLAYGPGNSGGSTTCTQGAASFHVKGVPDQEACIVSFAYPYSRKLYLNSVSGFASVTPGADGGANPYYPAEIALANCEATPSNINLPVSFEGFIPLPCTYTVPDGGVVSVGNCTAYGPDNSDGIAAGNAGSPFCEDLNEQMICGAATNNNACANLAANGVNLVANFQTTCGNGIIEPFEDCDLGAAVNGSAGASCSNTCRFTQ
jgi:hypothetical protein